MKTKLTPSLFITTLALVGFCLFQQRRVNQLKDDLASLQQSVSDHTRNNEEKQSLLKTMEKQQGDLKREVIRLNQEVRSAQTNALQKMGMFPGAPTVTATSAGENKGPTGFGDIVSKMMDDPEMKKVMRDQQRVVMDTMYGPLMKDLGLSPEEAEKFKSFLLDHQMGSMEKGMAWMKTGAADTDKTKAAEDMKAHQAQFDDDVKAFLGDERYAQFKDYQETLGDRMVLNQFSQQIGSSQNPLNAEQQAQLLQIMREENKNSPPSAFDAGPGAGPTPENLQATFSEEALNKHFERQDAINQRVAERAKGVLTPEQLEAFSTFQNSQRQMQRMGMSMAVKMFGGQKSGNGPAK